MNAWKNLSNVVIRGETREFLNSVEELPNIVRLAYASALTVIQLKLDERLKTTTFFYALCFHFEQNCKICLVGKEGRCCLSDSSETERIAFVNRLYGGIIKHIPKEFIEDGNK